MEPKQVNENLHVELAVVKILPDGSSVVISSEKLTKVLLESVAEIGQRLNGTIISITPKFPRPTTHTKPNSEKTTTIAQTMPVVPGPTQTTPVVPGPTPTQPNGGKTTAVTQIPPVVSTATPGTTTQAPVGPGEVAASKGGSNGGVIGGVVVAVLVVIIMVIALAVWYFR